MKLKTLFEAKKKEEKIVFRETNPQEPFPKDTITAIKKRINVFAKDLTTEWDSAIEMLDAVLTELKVPKPPAYLKERWKQYQELIEFTVENLHDARGFGGNWSGVIK
jgi:hypothetical protein